LFEHAVLDRFAHYFTTYDNQLVLKSTLVVVMLYTMFEMSLSII